MRRGATLLAAAATLALVPPGAPAVASDATSPVQTEWNFRVLLDGKPIGQHRFSVSTQGNTRTVLSEASFTVKVFGITAYRYRHKATELWRDDCLSALASTTDDDGKLESVRAATEGAALAVTAGAQTRALPGCVMSFAYWNPSIQTRTQLLNAQTGVYETVRVSRLGAGSVEVRGQPVAATLLRISGPAAPIDVWYSARGEWVGLDSTVAGGRTLSYRLP